MTSCRILASCLLALLLCPPGDAMAASDSKIEVHSLNIVGSHGVDAGQLKGILATKVSSRFPWGRKYLFDRQRFEADLQRVRAFYVDHGYPDAQITSFDVKLNSAQTKVDLTIHVSEGEPIRVTAIDYNGFDAVPARRLQFLKRRSPVKHGQPLDRGALVTVREQLTNELRDRGYPFARVMVQEQPGSDRHEVRLAFTARPGTLAYFGTAEVVGNKSVSDHVIERELLFKPGELYRRSLVQETQRKLYNLELFQFVNVQPVRPGSTPPSRRPGAGTPAPAGDSLAAPLPLLSDGTTGGSRGEASGGPSIRRAEANQPQPPQAPAGQPPSPQTPAAGAAVAEPAPDGRIRIPMRVTVAETKHRRFQLAVGYGTEEKGRVEARWHHVNFFGGARTAGLDAKWSSLDRGIRAEFTQPFLFGPRWSLQLDGQRWYDYEPAYQSIASGGHATVVYRPGTQTTLSSTFTHEYDTSRIAPAALADPTLRTQLIALGLDPRTGEQGGGVSALAFDLRRITAQPNPLNAFRGYVVAVHLEQAGGPLQGTFAYSNASLDVRHYLHLGTGLTLANRLQVGSLRPSHGLNSDIPFSKRYFLGGATSLRGWGRFEVSPLTGGGLPIGGLSMMAATSELRMRVRGQLGAVLFLDLGNVWADPWRLHLNDLRYDIGPGLRYNTPVGPLRVDLGYQLNPIPGLMVDGKPQTRRWRVHFSIGQAF